MGLDLIGQARSLYAYAGEVEGRGRDEDALAYRRDAGEYCNLLLLELPKGDFAVTVVRQLLYAAFSHPFFEALANSRDSRLAAIAAKNAKELAYHVRHSGEWIIRLGDGTDESHQRAQQALDDLWPYTGEMFESDEVEQELIEAGIAVERARIRPHWQDALDPIFAEANLEIPANEWMQTGGRKGRHTEHLGHMLAEMQFLQRAYPDARW
jgi:ring-1,2-phenylacetyl-CoA epoxidase subunit PaaC